MLKIQRYFIFFAFFLSGCAGLIYASIWSQYIALFLGRSILSQTFFLTLLMGGIAIGSRVAAKYIQRINNKLLYFAGGEVVLGLTAFIFHPIFIEINKATIPYVNTTGIADPIRWMLAALLILPLGTILGTKIPLLGSRLNRVSSYNNHNTANLYFTFGIGSALGIVLSTFIFIPEYGMKNCLEYTGICSLFIALSAFIISRLDNTTIVSGKAIQHNSFAPKIILLAASLNGFLASIYLISWERLISLSLNNSSHFYAITISIFIFGISLGSLCIRKQAGYKPLMLQSAGRMQIMVAFTAVLASPIYIIAQKWLSSSIISTLQKTDLSYQIYLGLNSGIALVLIIPASLFIGATLSLLSVIPCDKGHADKAAGYVLSLSMLGALLGYIAATQLGLVYLGVKYTIVAAAFGSLLLGLGLVNIKQTNNKSFVVLASLFALMTIIFTLGFDFKSNPTELIIKLKKAHPAALMNRNLYHEDGSTSSIQVSETPDGIRFISINKDIDTRTASNFHDTKNTHSLSPILLAALAVQYKPDAKYAAKLSMGTGVTSHTLLASKSLLQVETIEPEVAAIKASQYFQPMNKRIFNDVRSQITNNDARSFLHSTKKQYDIIVADAFYLKAEFFQTKEFYSLINRKLTHDGVFTQWLQLHKMSPRQLYATLRALDSQFLDYDLFLSNKSNLIIVASKYIIEPPILSNNFLSHELKNAGLDNSLQLHSRKIANKFSLSPLLNLSQSNEDNSDYFPSFGLQAAKDQFSTRFNRNVFNMPFYGVPFRELIFDSPLYSPEAYDDAHPFLLGYYEYIALIGGLKGQTGTPFDKLLQADIEVLQAPLDYCGQSIQKEFLWINLALRKAAYIHSNMNEATRLQFARSDFFVVCMKNSKSMQTKMAILLQAAISEHDWSEVFNISLRLLDTMLANQGENNVEMMRYTLNNYLFSAIMLNKPAALVFTNRNNQYLSHASNATTHWLQSILLK